MPIYIKEYALPVVTYARTAVDGVIAATGTEATIRILKTSKSCSLNYSTSLREKVRGGNDYNLPMMNNIPIAVVCSDSSRQLYAEKLALELKLKLVPKDIHDYPLLLVITESRLELQSTGTKAPGLYVDFLKGPLAHRRLFGGGRSQLIARAVGLKAHANPTVLDLTAGLGRDAFVLANLGCSDVTMLERHPIIAALLKDGLERAQTAEWFQSLKLKLIETDAQRYLPTLEKSFDVIYLDPMYPVGKKSALVKKEMRLLRDVVGADEDTQQLLNLALKKAKHRIVVKRPRLAPPLDGPIPNTTYTGKSSRFDVYF